MCIHVYVSGCVSIHPCVRMCTGGRFLLWYIWILLFLSDRTNYKSNGRSDEKVPPHSCSIIKLDTTTGVGEGRHDDLPRSRSEIRLDFRGFRRKESMVSGVLHKFTDEHLVRNVRIGR